MVACKTSIGRKACLVISSYALGHLISAQLNEAMQRDLGSLQLIAAGQEQQLRQWLAARVWPLGRSVNGEIGAASQRRAAQCRSFLRYLEKWSVCSALRWVSSCRAQ